MVASTPASAGGRVANTAGRTLVIDNSFELVTADPAHMFEPTGELVCNALYDTLLTFNGGNFKTVVPDLATSFQTLDGARKFVFHLNPAAKFSDGTPVTSADVVWSLTRLINLKGNPSFLLAGETITANGPETVVMTSAQPNPGLPYILPNPATGHPRAECRGRPRRHRCRQRLHQGHGRKLAQRQLGRLRPVHPEVVQHDFPGRPGRQPQLLGPEAGLLDRRPAQHGDGFGREASTCSEASTRSPSTLTPARRAA